MSLDRRERGSSADFISHAHTDHISAAKSSGKVIASRETIGLIKAAYGIEAKRAEIPSFGSMFELLESGHMLGAKQLYVKDIGDGRSLVYTGDFQVRGHLAPKAIETKHADIVVMDSTYPDPNIRFEDNAAVAEDIAKWTTRMLGSGIVLFGAYRMGKAQELIRILNKEGMVPVVSKGIGAVSGVYAESGVPLEYSPMPEAGDWFSIEKNFVAITENRGMMELAYRLSGGRQARVHTAVATGFANIFRFSTEAQFGLSSHADFGQATEYLDAVEPEITLTYGQNREAMAKNLNAHGYEAMPFDCQEAGKILNKGLALTNT